MEYRKPNVHIQVMDPGGNVLKEIGVHNTIVATGRNAFRDLLGYPDAEFSPARTPNYIALGTDSTAVTDADTALGGEVFRKALTIRQPADDTLLYQLYLDTTEANGNNLYELGLFAESTGGTMFARVTHGIIIKTVDFALAYNWEFTIASS